MLQVRHGDVVPNREELDGLQLTLKWNLALGFGASSEAQAHLNVGFKYAIP